MYDPYENCGYYYPYSGGCESFNFATIVVLFILLIIIGAVCFH
ncbi:sporulation protein YjcZ [Priestia filamentosa]|nr:sporulation protein YjcZ [Priestia filamentosa]